MNQLGGFPLLTLIISLPLLGAGITLAIPRDRRETARWVGLLTAASDLLVALFLVLGWVNDPAIEMQFVDGPWSHIASLGIAYHVGVDGISVPLILLTVLLVPLAMLLSAHGNPGSPLTNERVFWTLILEFGLLGALSALDLLLMVGFWTLSLFALVALSHQGKEAAGASSWMLVLAALAAASLIGTAVGAATPSGGYGLAALRAASFTWHRQAWLFWSSVVACSLTAALFPLHTWYTQVSRTVPIPLSLLTGALVLNLGVYGLLRISIALFPLAAVSFGPVLVVAGSAGLIYLSAAALGRQAVHDVLVHWRIAQGGLVVTGVFALQDLGLQGALLHSIASSLALSALLVLVTTNGGQASPEEGTARFHRLGVTIGFMSAIGVPGLAGFLGQALLVMQVLRWTWFASELPRLGGPWDWLWRGLVYGGMLLGVGALLRAWHRSDAPAGPRATQRTAIGLLIVILIVAFGVRPVPVSDAIGPAVYRLLAQVQEGADQDLQQPAVHGISDDQQSVHAASLDRDNTLPAVHVPPTVEPVLAEIRSGTQ